MSMKNDTSFLIDSRLSLYEHQSTYNPNMPLRLLHYIADLYESMVNPIKLYGSSPVQIPPPRFIVFYNGIKEKPEREDAFQAGIEQEKINTNREKERADTEKERADIEKERADTEKKRADKAASKMKDMEAELRKLREKIEKYEK